MGNVHAKMMGDLSLVASRHILKDSLVMGPCVLGMSAATVEQIP